MTGTYEDALEVFYRRDVFNYLASGCSRDVYRIGNVVYKVECGDPEADGSNETEYANYLALKDSALPANVAIPETTLYMVDNAHPVIAMEYVEGQIMAECYCFIGREKCVATCLPDDVRVMLSPFIQDTSGMNVISSNGLFYIIDLEF